MLISLVGQHENKSCGKRLVLREPCLPAKMEAEGWRDTNILLVSKTLWSLFENEIFQVAMPSQQLLLERSYQNGPSKREGGVELGGIIFPEETL